MKRNAKHETAAIANLLRTLMPFLSVRTATSNSRIVNERMIMPIIPRIEAI